MVAERAVQKWEVAAKVVKLDSNAATAEEGNENITFKNCSYNFRFVLRKNNVED